MFVFFFSSRRRHTRLQGDWSPDVCSSDLSDNPSCRIRCLVSRSSCASILGLRTHGHDDADHLVIALGPNNARVERSRKFHHHLRSEERREGKRVELGGGGIVRKKKGR